MKWKTARKKWKIIAKSTEICFLIENRIPEVESELREDSVSLNRFPSFELNLLEFFPVFQSKHQDSSATQNKNPFLCIPFFPLLQNQTPKLKIAT